MTRRSRGKTHRNTYKTGDRFNQKARDEGYRARSVYKLEEIQKRLRPLKQGQRVLDLGCAPGSWARYAQKIVGARGTVFGLDLQAVPSLPGVELVQADVFDVDPEWLLERLGGPPDVVLSDMAPSTSGVRFTDHVRQLELAHRAAELAEALLRPGGAFVCKVFDGQEAHAFVQSVRPAYVKTKRVKPEAVRQESVEFFLVCLDRKPA